MERKSRKFSYFVILVCALLIFAGALDKAAYAAKKFPTKQLRLIVPTPPGGGTDIMTRMLVKSAEPLLGKKIVVLNKAGGSGTIGTNAIVEAKPDGYTIGSLWNAPLTIVPHTLKITYTLDSFSYITWVNRGSVLFAVMSKFPAHTAEEFFEYVRKNPGLTYACDGVGNLIQFSGEKIFQKMNLKLRAVPYGGAGESIKALLGGHVDIYGGSAPPAIPHIKAGKVRGLFVTTVERARALPDVPGVKDLGCPETQTVLWRGIVGPKGIPSERLAVLEKAFRKAAQSQKVKDFLNKRGEEIVASSGKEFEEMVRAEYAGNAAIAKKLGFVKK